MSQFYVAGPAQVFVGTGASYAWNFLGYSEEGVTLRNVAAYRDVMADIGGPDVPTDVQFMGEQGYTSLVLSEYNELVFKGIMARRLGATAGAIEYGGMGSLMISQNFTYPLFIYCPYSTESFQSSSIVPGFTYAAAFLNDEYELPLSVQVKKPRVIFRAIPVWNNSALTAGLYTTVLPDPIPPAN